MLGRSSYIYVSILQNVWKTLMLRVVLGDGDGGGSTASTRVGVCDSAGGDAPATTSSRGSSNAGESVVGQM